MSTTNIKKFLSNDEGVSFVEYALLGALIAVACVLAVTAVGTSNRDLYLAVCNGVASATGKPPC